VSQDAEELSMKPKREALADNSVTIGHRYAHLFQQIVNARAAAELDNWDGNGASAVTSLTANAAFTLSTAFPQSLPVPLVQAEPTGEITFEWYKDRRHVAVIAVDGQFVRWSAIAGTDAPRSGAEPYLRVLPGAALDVVREVLG
jgi:hypothetical protein